MFTMILKYKNTLIGDISYDAINKKYRFKYSEEFKSQKKLIPLLEFPDVEKTYQSEHLFYYFEGRLPSIRQPKIMEIVKAKNIDIQDKMAMLREFGRKVITDPFILL